MSESSEKTTIKSTEMEAAQEPKKDKIPLEEKSKEDLIKHVKKTVSLLQTSRTKYLEINKRCGDLEKERDDAVEMLIDLKSKNHVESVKELQAKISKLEEFGNSKVHEVKSLHSQIKESNKEKETLRRQCLESEEQVHCMKMQLETLRVTCQCLQEDISKLNVGNSELKSEVDVLTNARDTALEALHSVKTDLSSARSVSTDLQSEINKLKEERVDLENKLTSAVESKQDTVRAFAQLEDETIELSKKYKDMCEENQLLQTTASDAAGANALLQTKEKELVEMERKYIEIEKLHSNFSEQITDIGCRYINLENEKLRLETCYKELFEENKNLKAEVVQTEKENILLLEAKSEYSDLLNAKAELEQGLMCVKEENDSLANSNQNYMDQISRLNSEMEEISKSLVLYENEKEFIVSEVKNCVESSVCESMSVRELVDALSTEYKKLQAIVSNFERPDENLNIVSVDCEKYQNEIVVLSEKLEGLMHDNMVLKLEVEKQCCVVVKVDELESEKSQLLLDKSFLVEKHDCAAKEVESLKLQLDEYENDIQKHLNLEKENDDLHDLVAELQRENQKLNESCESKCVELDDIFVHIDALATNLQERGHLTISSDAFQSTDDNFQRIVSLESMCDEMLSKFANNCERIKTLEVSLKEVIKSKENVCSELLQVQDLKQFLEDEVKELREESEQFKCVIKKTNHAAINTDEVFIPKSVTFKDVHVQMCVETSDVEISTESPAQEVESLNVLQHHNFSHDYIGAVSEWGCVEEVHLPPISNAEATIKELRDENQRLSDLLEIKSGLVDEIHCQVDLLLSKVEELNSERDEKDYELKSAHMLNADLQKQIKDLNNTIHRMQITLQKMSSVTLDMKQVKEQVPQIIEQLMLYCENTVSGINDEMQNIHSMYSNCYSHLQQCKTENASVKDESYHLKKYVHHLSEELVNELETLEESKRSDIFEESLGDLKPDPWSEYDVHNCSTEQLITKVHKVKTLFKCMVQCLSKLPLVQPVQKNANNHCIELKQQSPDLNTTDDQENCSSCSQLQKQLSETGIKMNKFKAVAIKMKKELAEFKQRYSAVCQERDNEVSQLSSEMATLSASNRQYVQNFQNLQNEYDKLQDESESLKSESKSFQADLVSKLNELSSFKLKLDEMICELRKAEDHLAASELEKGDVGKKLAEMESKLIVSESKYLDGQEKIQNLVEDLAQSQKEMSDLAKEKDELKRNLEEALMEGKQHSLMDLEMADYERTIAELTENLEKKIGEIDELKSEVDVQTSRIQMLEEEIKFCESHRETEEKRAEGFKVALESSKREVTLFHEQESSLRNEINQLCQKVEAFGLLEEDYKSQLSRQSAELEQMKEMLRSSGHNHERIVRSLNAKVVTLEQEILVAHKEVESVKQDFENYKIRVHSVLKQQKSAAPFSTSDAELKEQLESQNEKLKLQLKDLSEKLLAVNLEGESFRLEHEHLLQRHSKVVEELEAKDQSWSKRLELVHEDKKNLQLLFENVTSEQAMKSEMIATSYRKQMHILQSEHKRVIDELQKQLEVSDGEIARLQREQKKVSATNNNNSPMEDSFSFDILSQERQEGEGSECTDGENTPIRHLSLATIPTSGFMPLEKLIQSPDGSHTPTSQISAQDSERLTNELAASSKKIDHLSELLNESEANNLRWSEQVYVLKEEVRRLERNKQREEHSKNLEYLKNIFVKFATLQSGNEKARLIPVLNTMLKLSPAEVQQLKEAAGDDSEMDSSASGWGNYLHRWSGLM